ncbi:MAG: histidine--tRNA ligase [Pseudomonadota bacterium]
MAKKQKTFKPKARAPRGFIDRLGKDVIDEQQMLDRICAVYAQYGFQPLETSAFEYTDALGKFLPDIDRPNQGVFSLTDDDDQWMSLRYDLTAPLARFVAQNYDGLPKPFRRYARGPVWRNEKPGPGRFRQFTQCDADSVGAPAPHADVECCLMLADAIEAAGVAPDQFQIRLNDRNVLTGLLIAIGLEGQEQAETKLHVLRSMDKYDRLGAEGVAALLGPGRKDASGAFTEGANLADDQIAKVLDFMQATKPTNGETCDALSTLIGDSDVGVTGIETLSAMASQLANLGLDSHRAKIDLSVIRGLEYYTGPVFEAELLADLVDAKGNPVQIGSVASGGRYDDLIKRFKGIEVPAVGISVGVSRLLACLELIRGTETAAPGPVVILALDMAEMAGYQQMAKSLRANGIAAEVYMGGSGMKAQLKYADKRGAALVVIEGEDERARGDVTIKDLVLGAKLSANIEDNTTWREDQPAQFSVLKQNIVGAVKEVLARHG